MQNSNNPEMVSYVLKRSEIVLNLLKSLWNDFATVKIRGIDSVLFKKKQGDISPYPAPSQALITSVGLYVAGLKYGMQTMKGTMSAIIRKFKILPGNTPLQLHYKITLTSLTGMKIRLESR
jgi:hypothetical protein